MKKQYLQMKRMLVTFAMMICLMPVMAQNTVVNVVEQKGTITQTSTLYVGEVLLDGQQSFYYLYSEDMTNSESVFAAVRDCLQDFKGGIYSALVPDIVGETEDKGIAICSNSAYESMMNADWKDAYQAGQACLPGKYATSSSSENLFETDADFAANCSYYLTSSGIDLVDDAGEPLAVSGALGRLTTSVTDDVSYTVIDGNLVKLINRHYSYTFESVTVIYTKVELSSSPTTSYIDADGIEKSVVATELTGSSSATTLSSGWYVVGHSNGSGNIKYSNEQFVIEGDVHLILRDNYTMTVCPTDDIFDDSAIRVNGNLTIYGQAGGTGTLNANGTEVGIFFDDANEDTKTLTINGGTVNASGNYLGISSYNEDTNLIINGGCVSASGDEEGITCDNVTINGGSISASGVYGIDIFGSITINGGTVTSTGTATGIAAQETVTINNGTVIATGTNDFAIYGYDGVTINNGTVSATGSIGIYSGEGNITLGYANAMTSIYASNLFVRFEDEGYAITIAEGKTFTDGTNRYDHTTASEVLAALTDVTLTPHIWGIADGNDGTADKPYTIGSTLDLDCLAYRVNNGNDYADTYFVMTANIDYDTSGLGAEECNYTAIGSYYKPFSGIFDGQHYTISGIRIYAPDDNYLGLFGYVNGTVRNVAVSDASITGNYYVGGIAGYTRDDCMIENCLVAGSTFNYLVNSNNYCFGGVIAGEKINSTFSHNYYSGCTVNSTANATNVGCGHWYISSDPVSRTGDITDNDGAVSCTLHTMTLGTDITAQGIMVNQNGTLSVVEGTTVTLNHGDREHSSFIGYEVKDADNADVTVTETDGVYTFTMPNKDVTVTVKWRIFYILADDADNTDLIASASAVGEPLEITLQGRTLYKDGGWNTLCLPFALSDFEGTPLAGATVKTLASSSFDNGTLTLNFTDAESIEAGKPYIVKWETSEDIVNPVFSNLTVTNTLTDIETDIIDFIGTYAPVDFGTEENRTVLLMGPENNLFYPDGTTNSYVNACRGYFQLADGYVCGDPANGNGIKEFIVNFDDEATGIQNEEFRMKNSEWFTLDGRHLQGKPVVKGVYINNGKKVLIK